MINVLDIVFNRVFNSDDVHLRPVQYSQHGIQSGCFSGTGRPADQNHSVTFLDILPNYPGHILKHSQFFEGKWSLRRRQKAHLHFFTVIGRHHRDTDIQNVRADFLPETTVLRLVMLVNFQTAKQFYARHDGRVDFFGHPDNFVEHAVDAVTDKDVILENFGVDIRGARRKSVSDKIVHNGNDRHLGRRFRTAPTEPQGLIDIRFDYFFEFFGKMPAVKGKSFI